MAEFATALHDWAINKPWVFWLLVTALGGLSGWGFYQAFRGLSKARLIEDTATARIRSAPQGYVELIGIGKCMSGEPIVAPLTGQRCCWFSYVVEERVQSGRNSRWRTVSKGTSDGLFLLSDGEAHCIVDPVGAEIVPGSQDRWYGNSANPDIGPKAGGPWLGIGARYRYHERRIAIGSPLYAVGWFQTDSTAPTPAEMDLAVAQRLKEWKQSYDHLLQRFDEDGDGQIDMQEWQVVRAAAKHEVGKEQKAAAPKWGLDILKKPADGRSYLLAARDQAALARYYRIRGLVGLLEFFIAGIMAVWMTGAGLAG